MIKWFRLLCIILVIHESTSKWCQQDLCNGQHVLCKDNGKFQSTCPRDATATVKMSQDMINIIVDKHNDFRNKFAGGIGNHARAARMTTMQWDSRLATVADALVRQCQPIRDQCSRTKKYPHTEVSYSLEKYFCMTTKKNALIKQLELWFDPNSKEDAKKLFLSLKEQEQEFSKNYFQVIRDRTNRVGCAIVEFIKPSLVHQLLKCVYNCGVSLCEDNNNPVYEQTDNEATGECKRGSNMNYKNLCHKDELVKNCDGGHLFVVHGNDDDYEPKPTKYPLPEYIIGFSLPPIPDNPPIEYKSMPYDNNKKSDSLAYLRDFSLPEIPDNPSIDFRSNPYKAKQKHKIEKNSTLSSIAGNHLIKSRSKLSKAKQNLKT
ncbi:venom allergen 5.01 [Drosophila rhopaloa]|uniref:SCP domain-containing protein n=1 Tax=Drosophila rhopaloa TaxID=1041015 RepID=A0ABM5GXA4_DRORH|nr:venom allergen 5.01 [Drosophila rhopaloa]